MISDERLKDWTENGIFVRDAHASLFCDMASELLQWRQLGRGIVGDAPLETPLGCGGECPYGLDLQIWAVKIKQLLAQSGEKKE